MIPILYYDSCPLKLDCNVFFHLHNPSQSFRCSYIPVCAQVLKHSSVQVVCLFSNQHKSLVSVGQCRNILPWKICALRKLINFRNKALRNYGLSGQRILYNFNSIPFWVPIMKVFNYRTANHCFLERSASFRAWVWVSSSIFCFLLALQSVALSLIYCPYSNQLQREIINFSLGFSSSHNYNGWAAVQILKVTQYACQMTHAVIPVVKESWGKRDCG